MDFEQQVANILPDDILKIVAQKHGEKFEYYVDFTDKRDYWWRKFAEHDSLNGLQDKQDAWLDIQQDIRQYLREFDNILEYRATGNQLLSDLGDIIKYVEDLIVKNTKMMIAGNRGEITDIQVWRANYQP